MTRPPSTTTLFRQLQDIVRRMEAVEITIKEMGNDLDELTAWHRETDYAKKILTEYQQQHPETGNANNINAKAWAAVIAALTALTAILLATLK